MARSISVIIPNYNGEELIPVFMPTVIAALEKYDGSFELIFVDDCSTDGSLDAVSSFAERRDWFQIITAKRNGGFSKTCNLGVKAAMNEILFFLNTDVALTENYFQRFSKFFDDADLFGVTTCGYRYQTNDQIDGIKIAEWKRGSFRATGNILNGTLAIESDDGPYLSFSVQGAHFFADAAKTRELQAFDEIYSPFIFEETDLAYRALKRGWKITYDPESVSYHQIGASLRKAAKPFRYKSISARNRLIFIWKNIHSARLLFSHVGWQLLRLLSLNAVYWAAFLGAIKRLPLILRRRANEKRASIITDEELLEFFGDYFNEIRRKG